MEASPIIHGKYIYSDPKNHNLIREVMQGYLTGTIPTQTLLDSNLNELY